jgi:hypothetical protein
LPGGNWRGLRGFAVEDQDGLLAGKAGVDFLLDLLRVVFF